MDYEHTIPPPVEAPQTDDSHDCEDPIERWLLLADTLLGKKPNLPTRTPSRLG